MIYRSAIIFHFVPVAYSMCCITISIPESAPLNSVGNVAEQSRKSCVRKYSFRYECCYCCVFILLYDTESFWTASFKGLPFHFEIEFMRMNILIILNDCCDDYLLEYESICSKYITNVKSFGKKKNNMKPAAIATSNNNNWRSSVATIAKCTQTFCMKIVFSLSSSFALRAHWIWAEVEFFPRRA